MLLKNTPSGPILRALARIPLPRRLVFLVTLVGIINTGRREGFSRILAVVRLIGFASSYVVQW